MIEIGRLGELDKASHYPKEVQEKILEAIEMIRIKINFSSNIDNTDIVK